MWNSVLHANSIGSRNQRTFVLCGKHFAFHIWFRFILSFKKINQNTERKHKLRRSFSFTSQSTQTYAHTQASSHTYLSVPSAGCQNIYLLLFSARGTLEMSTEKGAEERQRNGKGDEDGQAEGSPQAAFVAGAAKYATLALRYPHTHICLCNLGCLFIFIIHL